MEGGARCGELAATSASQDSDGVFGRDAETGGIVGVGAVVPGSVPVATIPESCCSFPSRGRDNVAVEVVSWGAVATTTVGDACVG
jgi:hypothetical protein